MIPAVLSILLVPVLYFLTAPLERTFNFQQQFFWLIPVCLFLNFCFEAFIILIRNQNNVKLFTIVSLLKVVVEIGFSILFVVFIYRNWYSRALGFLLSGLVVGTIFFLYAQRNKFLVKRVNFKVLQKELYFGLSGLLLQTAIFFVGTSDKFFVMFFFGKEKAGYYSVASTFAAIQYLVCAALLQYLSPLLYKKFADLQKWTALKYLYFKYFAVMFVTFVGVTFFTFIVYHFILKTAYKDYVYYSYFLGISSFLWTISNVFLQYIIFNKSKRIILTLSATTIFISILLNYFASKYGDVQWLCIGQIVITSLLLLVVMVFNKRLNFFN
jgi:O-antigen/teichoic acid export membrane protein